MKKPLVAVLGCGPSGLLAAHACSMYNVSFAIFSRPEKSKLGGAQYSHIPVPGIHEDDTPEATLRYEIRGDPETYREKVYGTNRSVPFVSMENVFTGKTVSAWNLRKLYDALWTMYEEKIIPLDLNPYQAIRFDDAGRTFDLVFSSIPAPAICLAPVDPSVSHWFREQPILIHNDNLQPLEDNTIVYDGTKDRSWYRMSKIFGVGSTEWGGGSPVPPIPDLRSVKKPIATNCDCHDNIIRVGRFGTWQKGVLTFHAYNRVVEELVRYGAAEDALHLL